MNKYKFILLYIAFFCAVGCKTKQKTIEKVSETKSDTLIMKSKVIETPPILTSLNILEICDTVTGKPKEFRYRYVVEKDTLEVNLLNNELSISNNQLSQIKRQLDSITSIRESQTTSVKEDTKKVYRWNRWTWIFLGTSILFLVFPIIPNFANKSARKIIGLF